MLRNSQAEAREFVSYERDSAYIPAEILLKRMV